MYGRHYILLLKWCVLAKICPYLAYIYMRFSNHCIINILMKLCSILAMMSQILKMLSPKSYGSMLTIYMYYGLLLVYGELLIN